MINNANLELLYRLGDETRNLSEPEDIMATVATAVGRALAVSRCAYADVEADSNHFTIYRDYTDNCPSSAGNYELALFGDRAHDLLRRGKKLVIHDVDAELTAEDGGDSFTALSIKAIVCCSLVKNGRLVAMMALHQVEPRQWREDEIALMHEVVERCWSTIERARAQKLAQQNEQKFKALFEHAPDAQVLLNGDGIIQLANKHFEAMFDVQASEVIGTHARTLLPSAVIDDCLQLNAPLPETAGSLSHAATQVQIQNSSGETFYVEINQNPIQTDDGVLCALSIRDVSERIRLENELLQAKKIETLGMLAGGIAHDFNNLLTVIIGTAELPLHKDQSDFRFRKEFETIRSVGSRAGELTQQLLAFSRQQVLQPEIIDLNEAVQASQDIITRLIGENIGVRLDLEAGLLSVNLDKTQLEQVLMNLAANARDAMLDGGTLTIATSTVASLPEHIVSDASSPQGFVRLCVIDTGNGMSADETAKVFDPFYTTKGTGEGTGLGLSTVYGIIMQSDGHIAVRSEPGSGSEFEMYFPAVAARPKGEADDCVKVGSRVAEKILIVEDEPDLREVLYELLLACGYTVESAALGEDALEIFLGKPDYFDLIITDVIMPGMSGPKFIEEVKRHRENIKVIFSSGYTADAIGHHGVLERDQNFLSKPYRYEDLEQLVRGVLDG